MKKIIFTVATLLGVISTYKSQDNPLTVYGGINFAGASSKEFTSFDISDWEKYGLLSQNPSSSEGRVRVDLASLKPKALNLGIMLGARYNLSEKFSALAELQYAVSGISLISLYIGGNYEFFKGEKFSLGVTPKIGYNMGSADLGAITLIDGYTPPVILPEGTFNVGDALSMEFSGLAINLGLTPSFAITEKISATGFLGYNLGFVSTDGLLCNGVVLPMTAKGVVKSDGLNTQAGINPSLSSSGLNIQLGVAYKF
jgi:hypothetical protein